MKSNTLKKISLCISLVFYLNSCATMTISSNKRLTGEPRELIYYDEKEYDTNKRFVEDKLLIDYTRNDNTLNFTLFSYPLYSTSHVTTKYYKRVVPLNEHLFLALVDLSLPLGILFIEVNNHHKASVYIPFLVLSIIDLISSWVVSALPYETTTKETKKIDKFDLKEVEKNISFSIYSGNTTVFDKLKTDDFGKFSLPVKDFFKYPSESKFEFNTEDEISTLFSFDSPTIAYITKLKEEEELEKKRIQEEQQFQSVLHESGLDKILNNKGVSQKQNNSKDSVKMSLAMSKTYMGQKKIDKAINEIKKAVSTNSENNDLLYLLADLYMQNGEFEKSIIIYKVIARNNPNDYKAYYCIASVYCYMADATGDPQSAGADFLNKGLDAVHKSLEIKETGVAYYINAQVELRRGYIGTKYFNLANKFDDRYPYYDQALIIPPSFGDWGLFAKTIVDTYIDTVLPEKESDNVSRLLDLADSYYSGKNLTSATQSAIKNELFTHLKKQFKTKGVSDTFILNFVVNYLDSKLDD